MFYCSLESCILDQHSMETPNIFSLKLDRLLSRRQYDKKYLVTTWKCTQVTLDAITMVCEHQYCLYPKLFIFPIKIFEPNSQWLFPQAELSILCHVSVDVPLLVESHSICSVFDLFQCYLTFTMLLYISESSLFSFLCLCAMPLPLLGVNLEIGNWLLLLFSYHE